MRMSWLAEHYFIKLQDQIDHYSKKYPNSPKKVAFKLIFWNFKNMLMLKRAPKGEFYDRAHNFIKLQEQIDHCLKKYPNSPNKVVFKLMMWSFKNMFISQQTPKNKSYDGEHYFIKLQERMDHYSKKYPNSPNKVAFKLMLWNLKNILTQQQILNYNEPYDNEPNRLKLALSFLGGQGDILIAFNYLFYLEKLFEHKNVIIDIFLLQNYDFSIKNIFVDNIYIKKNISYEDYDVVIRLARFPEILKCDLEKVERLAPGLIPLMEKYQKFKENYYKFFNYAPCCDTLAAIYSMCNGQKRIQQADIDGILGISARFKIVFFVKNRSDILKKFALDKVKFITLHRGIDVEKKIINGSKIWSLEHYNELIALLKATYPQYTLVQLGASREYCRLMDGTDIELVGKTDLEDVKALMKYAALHIDGEGGMVHLRAALRGGKSVVLFGPTAVELFGYEENINIRAEGACAHWCEWVSDTWDNKCIKNNNIHNCMKSITPTMVMNRLKKVQWSNV
jgi:ADP-heptose:LPS heptosyltransferase